MYKKKSLGVSLQHLPLLQSVIFPSEVCHVDGGEFENLVAKLKCKSKVRKHFNFPADAHGEIMGKKNIACQLCKVITAYSGNTSNLTYHVQRAHSQELVELSGDKPGLSILPTVKQP